MVFMVFFFLGFGGKALVDRTNECVKLNRGKV